MVCEKFEFGVFQYPCSLLGISDGRVINGEYRTQTVRFCSYQPHVLLTLLNWSTWLEEFKQYEHIKTLERRVVVELIDHIDVHSKTEIEIHFCFEDELHSITEKFMEYQAYHGNEVAEE